MWKFQSHPCLSSTTKREHIHDGDCYVSAHTWVFLQRWVCWEFMLDMAAPGMGEIGKWGKLNEKKQFREVWDLSFCEMRWILKFLFQHCLIERSRESENFNLTRAWARQQSVGIFMMRIVMNKFIPKAWTKQEICSTNEPQLWFTNAFTTKELFLTAPQHSPKWHLAKCH